MSGRFLRVVLAVMVLAGTAAYAAAADTPEIPAAIQQYVDSHAPAWVDRPALATALADAGSNWQELSAALDIYRPPDGRQTDAGGAYSCMLWLITHAPHLDRLELTKAVLTDDVELAMSAAKAWGYDTESDFFRRNVLNYRLDDEPVTNWRGEIARRYSKASEGLEPQDPQRISRIVVAVTAGFKTIERGFFGNLADPLSIDNARAGTDRELALLTGAALRAQGFGVRFVRENLSTKSWVEVYTGPGAKYDATAWTPVYPSAPTQTGYTNYAPELCGGRIAVVTAGDAFGMEQVTMRYSEVCAVKPTILRGGEELMNYEGWTLSAWYDGRFVPLDDLGYPVSAEDYPLEKPAEGAEEGVYYVGAPGDYRATAGARYHGGIVHVLTKEFHAEPGGRVELTLTLDPPADLPLSAFVERTVGEDAPQQGTHLYVVIDEHEPSTRTLGLLEPLKSTAGLDYVVLEAHTSDAQAEALLSMLKVVADDPKPVVVLIRDGKTLLYQRGYNLNIAGWVERALAQ